MNLQEHIRKVLKEETNIMRMVSRRLPPGIMDKEFESALKYVSRIFLLNFKGNSSKLSKKEFTRMVGIDLIDGLDLRNILPKDVEWYDDALKGLTEHYKERISSMYNVLKK
jgi:hypothetical protein